MLRSLALVTSLIHFCYAELPNLLFHGVQHQRRVELAVMEHSAIWEQAIASQNLILDVREIIDALGNKTHRLSNDCSQDIELLVDALLDLGKGALKGNVTLSDFDKEVILPMLDSAGRIGPGILRGHTYFEGHFSECKDIDFAVENRTRHFNGEYFRIAVDVVFRDNSVNGSCEREALAFKFGLCLPAGCSSADLMAVFRPETGKPVIKNPVCEVKRTNDDVAPIDTGFYVVVSIMGVIATVSVLAGLTDYYFGDIANKTGVANSIPWRLFMSFSLYTNASTIFDYSVPDEADQIGPIHCIRFFSLSWIILGNVASAYSVLVANPLDIVKVCKDLIVSEILMQFYYGYDSFFFVSGVLLTFIWFKNYQKNPRVTNSPVGWIMFYVHRIICLVPPYYMLIVFYTFVYKQILVDLPINMSPLYQDHCRETWYIDFLYAHNWWQQDKQASTLRIPSYGCRCLIYVQMCDLQCLGITWYLASEMQIFLFTPLLIIPLAIKPAIGFIIAAVAFIISTGTNIFLVYYYHWPTNRAILFTPDPEMTHYLDDYNMLMYDSPLIRCQACFYSHENDRRHLKIYIMGMLVGWLLQYKKTMKINPLINLACWISGLSLMFCVVLGLHDQSNGFMIPIFWRAMYSSLSRVAWGIGLSWIIISCYYGYGGPINKCMSWHIWIPFGRLTYCGYLTHIPIMLFILGQSTDTVFFTTLLEAFITRVVSTICVTYFMATFWSSMFEISFQKVYMILLGGSAEKEQSNIEESWTSKDREGDNTSFIPSFVQFGFRHVVMKAP